MDIESPVNDMLPSASEAAPFEPGPLGRAFANFAQSFSAVLAGQLCAVIDSAGFDAVQQSEAAALREAAGEGYVAEFDVEPRGGVARLVLGGRFACWAADLLLGAPLAFAGQSRDCLTDLDRRSIDTLIDAASPELGKAFGSISGCAYRRSGREIGVSEPADGDSPVVVLKAELKFAEATSFLALILPLSLTRRNGDSRIDGRESRELTRGRMIDALASAMVDVDAVIRGSDMRLCDLARLRPGMVLALPHKAGSPLDCQVNGVATFRGEMTRSERGVGLVIQSVKSQRATELDGSSRS